jgi:ubiquinone/menaquinone biosynthesis C-methylase UbiE
MMGMPFFIQKRSKKSDVPLKTFYIGGILYDWLLEPPLKNIKKHAARFISDYELYPALDICCGSGTQCHRIVQWKNEVYGLDLDERMIQYASTKYPQIPFMCADAEKIPIKDSCVRGVILSFALHDKYPETRTKMLQEIRRILYPEGKVVFVDFECPWNRTSKMASLYIYGIERLAGRVHFRNGRNFLAQGGLRSFLEKNGLAEIERYDVDMAHTGIVVAEFIGGKRIGEA